MQLDKVPREQISHMAVLQSLFCWKVVCNIIGVIPTDWCIMDLQSLFCWKVVCNCEGTCV